MSHSPLYSSTDEGRIFDETSYRTSNGYRTPFRRDLDRLIHSACFRRLQGKTQLYPGLESDFFRNRLTHSLEVAQVAKGIAAKVNYEQQTVLDSEPINLDIVEFAGLAHDLGHPPFGHQGEEMLNELMREHSGYEGNAQTLRILTRIEKKGFGVESTAFTGDTDKRNGLNLSARTLASILKYDQKMSEVQAIGSHPQKAYYSFDESLVDWIKKSVGYDGKSAFKTIECQIMDLADDIAYSTYDLEDGLKAGFYTLMDVVFCNSKLRKAIAKEVKVKGAKGEKMTENEVGIILQKLFQDFAQFGEVSLTAQTSSTPRSEHIGLVNAYHEILNAYSFNGYLRNYLSSSIVNRFIEGIQYQHNSSYPSQSKVFFNDETLREVEVLKKFTFTSQVLSSRLKVAEVRGKEIVKEIFETLANAERKGYELLPADYREMYDTVTTSTNKRRIVCDFVAGMTDRYAIEFYARLKSENPETIFKPLD